MTMTMADAVGRIAQIQSTLTQLSRPGAPATPPASATAFASTLANAAAPAAAEAATGSGAAVAAAGALGSAAASDVSAPSGASGRAGAAGGVTGSSVVSGAQKYLGVPYVFGGEDASGMDCSGLVQRVFADLGIEVPRLVSGQAAQGTEVASLKDAKPGDLLVTHGNTHIVIYAGDGKIIHAPRPGKDVRLVDNYLRDADIRTIRRVVPAEASATAPASAAATVPRALPAATAPTDVLTAALRSALAGSTS